MILKIKTQACGIFLKIKKKIYLHIYTFISVPETHPELNLVDRKSLFYLSEQPDRLDEAFSWFSER